jgi:enoyl-CoA hydratase
MAAGAQFAAGVAAKSPLAVANAKEMMNHIWAEGLSVSAGLQVEKERNSYYCLTSSDATEGLIAFRDKRTPRFTGT